MWNDMRKTASSCSWIKDNVLHSWCLNPPLHPPGCPASYPVSTFDIQPWHLNHQKRKKKKKRQYLQEWLKNGLWSAARSNPWINPSVDCYSVLQDVWIYLIYKKNKWYTDGQMEDLHCWPLCTCQRCVSTAERTWGCWCAGRAARCS